MARRDRRARVGFGLVVLLAMTVLARVAAAASAPAPRSGEWDFEVSLDGKPIGEHRFRLEPDGDGSRLTSQARFDVKVLGLTVFRYRHQAVEQWRDGCLVSLVSSTDDDGKPGHVHFIAAGDGDIGRGVRVASAPSTPVGCVMSFAYWNPAMRMQTRLLNAQTGKFEDVHIACVADAPIMVHGEPVAARACRVAGASRPVDVWYAVADGAWIGLDAVVDGGRKLSYRLR